MSDVQPDLAEAMRHCAYKAWQLSQDDPRDSAPAFYKIPHCAACQFKNDCYKKLKEKDCISLLPGVTPKVLAKYHNKGVSTITQLSYLFKPRRRKTPNPRSSYLWELKALAIREQQTFVIEIPVFADSVTSIYIDFEGLSDEDYIYLIGALVIKDDQVDRLSFWSDGHKPNEDIFRDFLGLLNQYPDAPIYHFGSYESKGLKQAIKRWPALSRQWESIEKKMVNLLAYLRTHIYPPTYGNGLKELGTYLNFSWSDPKSDGLLSMQWRKEWQDSGLSYLKDKLIRYNLDDCDALYTVHQWFKQLGAAQENVQQVSSLKKHSPWHLQHNKDYGDDFQQISKAAYFDYQRNKVYWRNELKKESPAGSSVNDKPKPGRGLIAWTPKVINEVIILPPRKRCPGCGHTRLYQSHETKSSVIQTDLKFTASGIRQHVTDFRSGNAKCAKCGKKLRNQSLRIMHYGDNLFALAINYYVNYHVSNEMISKLIQEHYGIWISPMYLVMYKNTWWKKNWASVAKYIKAIVLHSPVIHIDKTTIKLSRESGYVWVFATTHTVYYHYAPSREVSFLQEWLKDYQGVIVSDFYPGYETLKLKSQKCLVHLIRDLNDDLFKRQYDQEYKAFVAAFNQLLRKIIQTVDRQGLQKKYLGKHIADTSAFYSAYVDRDYKSDLAAKYAKRFKRNWEQLWTFLQHDNVPWNNNNAEAAVKAFAQHRRGVKGMMHVKGITDYLQMLTVAQTCRYRNISFLSFLRKKKGIWENIPAATLPGFLPFEQARLYVHRLGFERQAQWNEWKQQRKRPSFIPSAPDKTYKTEGWIDWHDWIGFDFLPFTKARTYMRRQQLKSRTEYKEWLASDKRPKFIPASPEKEYKHTGWISINDYLGIVKIVPKNSKK